MNDQTSIVAGLRYFPDYLSHKHAHRLLEMIDRQPWVNDLRRRVQHYGYRYDYRRRFVDQSLTVGPLPDWGLDLAERFVHHAFVTRQPDQLIVNEYQPGQGIAIHVDCIPCFAETILCLSLGSPCVMNFTQADRPMPVSLLVEPESLLVFQGEARYKWKHCIPARKTDAIDGMKISRTRRVSLTFRTVTSLSSKNRE